MASVKWLEAVRQFALSLVFWPSLKKKTKKGQLSHVTANVLFKMADLLCINMFCWYEFAMNQNTAIYRVQSSWTSIYLYMYIKWPLMGWVYSIILSTRCQCWCLVKVCGLWCKVWGWLLMVVVGHFRKYWKVECLCYAWLQECFFHKSPGSSFRRGNKEVGI